MKQTRWASVLAGLLATTPAAAQPAHDWSIHAQGTKGYLAATVNESFQVLGQFCFSETTNCTWMLSLDKNCIKGEKYPVLINGNAGALPTELICNDTLDGGKQRYIFANFDNIDRAIRSSPRIAIAIPVEGDAFSVIRFSMKGALETLKTMHSKLKGNSVPAGTRDLRM